LHLAGEASLTDFVLKQLPYDLSGQAGLALIGKRLKRININALVDPAWSARSGVANSDVLKSYLGLLCLGKSDFDAIEAQRKEAFFARALGLRAVPSSPTLRRRLDTHAADWFDLADRIDVAVLSMKMGGKAVDFCVLPCGYTPLELGTFAMDQSGTAKELNGRTYTGVDGYCPFVAYSGTQGFCLEFDRRAGTQHSASESQHNLARVLPLATKLTPMPILLRADSGFKSAKLMATIATHRTQACREAIVQAAAQATPQGKPRDIAFIIKWNQRSTPVEDIAKARCADAATQWVQLRAGKRQCLWEQSVQIKHEGQDNEVQDIEAENNEAAGPKLRRILRPTERTLGKRGQPLLLPLYTLHDKDSPVRHPAQRRRVRTVMQELMFNPDFPLGAPASLRGCSRSGSDHFSASSLQMAGLFDASFSQKLPQNRSRAHPAS
jgi:hypothetical protein